MNSKRKPIIIGLMLAAVAIVLAYFGNPGNMGICLVCFIRDVAGGLKFHTSPVTQYIRPEIAGIIIGAMLMAQLRGRYQSTGGSDPLIRFILGAVMAIGALIFLGCPTRMLIRMSAGDINAYIGFIGFVAGIYVGVLVLRAGFNLGRAQTLPRQSGRYLPLIVFAITLMAMYPATKHLFAFSQEGPGSMHAPVLISLGAAMVFGAIAQWGVVCFTGSFRDVFLTGQYGRLVAIVIFFVTLLVYNLVTKNFHWSMVDQPIAHSESLWNIIGLFIVGLCGVLLEGCPLRQLVMMGQGSSDAAITFLGLLVGTAVAHNFSLASSGDGTTAFGRVAALGCLGVIAVIVATHRGQIQEA